MHRIETNSPLPRASTPHSQRLRIHVMPDRCCCVVSGDGQQLEAHFGHEAPDAARDRRQISSQSRWCFPKCSKQRELGKHRQAQASTGKNWQALASTFLADPCNPRAKSGPSLSAAVRCEETLQNPREQQTRAVRRARRRGPRVRAADCLRPHQAGCFEMGKVEKNDVHSKLQRLR